MPGTYLVELYLPRQDAGSIDDVVARAHAAARVLNTHGAQVRFVRSIFVPGDDSAFCVWEGDSADLVGRASLLADLPFQRVVAAIAPEESR